MPEIHRYYLSPSQIEYHPTLDQTKMLDFARKTGMLITAYSPLGHGHLLSNETLQKIADKHSASIAQICIARLLQQRCVVIPKASARERIQENFNAQKIVLDVEDLKMIDTLPKSHRYVTPPLISPKWNE
ncbi:hypothetical protein AGMMS50249_7640 [candidate division SR1 bacterium]|nr:hypothetical protein AGMMS50249_7640 [candidate division SR1 bacterium]